MITSILVNYIDHGLQMTSVEKKPLLEGNIARILEKCEFKSLRKTVLGCFNQSFLYTFEKNKFLLLQYSVESATIAIETKLLDRRQLSHLFS